MIYENLKDIKTYFDKTQEKMMKQAKLYYNL